MVFNTWSNREVLTDDAMMHYLDVLRGDMVYDGSDDRVIRFETFLYSWIERSIFPDKFETMVRLSEMALADYSYTGEMYRGISLRHGKTLAYGYVTSFTSSDLVAEEFASGDEKVYQGYVFCKTDTMFDLAAMVGDVQKLTSQRDLLRSIKDNLYEEEKIGYFDESCEDISEYFVFRE